MGNKQCGFTLPELLITVAIAGIVLGLGIPSLQSVMETNQLAAQVNNMVGALNIARSEAVKRNVNVSVINKGTDWNDGWQVFIDTNSNGSVDSTEEVIHSFDALPAHYTVEASTNFAPIRYTPDGRLDRIAGNMKFAVNGTDARQVTVAATGRIRTEVL